MHLLALELLPLHKLKEELGLLGDIEGDILLNRRPWPRTADLEICLPPDNLCVDTSRGRVDDEASFFSSKYPESEARDALPHVDGVDVVLVIVEPQLSILEADEDALDVLRPPDVDLANIRDFSRHQLREVDPSLVVERVQVPVHRREHYSLIKFNQSCGLGLDLDLEAARDVSVLYLIGDSVSASDENLILDVEAPRGDHEHGDALELEVLSDAKP